jgi:small conductance mechanosensitive channel
MESQQPDVILATRTALSQASALAVQYSFSIVGALVLLCAGWLVARLLHNWAYAGLKRVHGIDETLARFFSNIIRYALLVLVFVTVLGQFGVQTASIIAALGAAGLAVGLALQGTLQNIAAGIMLLVLRPFRVGESIETSSVTGTIREIGLFATELVDSDGVYRLAPNSSLWNTPVRNFSREPTRKHDISVSVGRDRDLDATMRRLLDIATSQADVLATPAPSVFVSEFSNDSTGVTLRYWASTPKWWATTRAMLKRVNDEMAVLPEPEPARADGEQGVEEG